MNATQTELTALAALVGITPDTHRQFVWDTSSGEPINVSGFPSLITFAGDDVFLAPVLRWLRNNARSPSIYEMVVNGWSGCVLDDEFEYHSAMSYTTATLALVRACQSARVPEVVAIFGEGE